MAPSSQMPEWMPDLRKKADGIATSGRPLLGGSKDKMQAVPDFATILDHYAKNKKKIHLPARYVYHPEQVNQIKSSVQAGLEFLPDIQVGDYTIIHVGFGISQLDEEEAQRTLEMLREMEMLADELPELDGGLQT